MGLGLGVVVGVGVGAFDEKWEGRGRWKNLNFGRGYPKKRGAAVGRKNWAGVVGVKPQW